MGGKGLGGGYLHSPLSFRYSFCLESSHSSVVVFPRTQRHCNDSALSSCLSSFQPAIRAVRSPGCERGVHERYTIVRPAHTKSDHHAAGSADRLTCDLGLGLNRLEKRGFPWKPNSPRGQRKRAELRSAYFDYREKPDASTLYQNVGIRQPGDRIHEQSHPFQSAFPRPQQAQVLRGV